MTMTGVIPIHILTVVVLFLLVNIPNLSALLVSAEQEKRYHYPKSTPLRGVHRLERRRLLSQNLTASENNNTETEHGGKDVLADVEEFLAAHNGVRKEFSQPLFTWDEALACYAREWGAKRYSDCKMIHSCGPYGENLFWGKSDRWTPTHAVLFWADERKFYDVAKSKCVPGQMCGHFTQIVWKDSMRIGCARQKCLCGGVLIICEYDPPGNYVGENPFVSNSNATQIQ